MRADDALITAAAVNLDGYCVAAFLEGDALSAQPDLDAFSFENRLDGFGNVFVFTLDEPRSHFHDGDVTAEAPVHLSKLQPHVAAANDDQMLGEKVHVHHC